MCGLTFSDLFVSAVFHSGDYQSCGLNLHVYLLEGSSGHENPGGCYILVVYFITFITSNIIRSKSCVNF